MHALAVVLALSLFTPAADPARVSAEPKAEDGTMSLVVGAPGTVDRELGRQLKNGLTHRVRYTLTLHGEGETAPFTTDVLTTEVVYDLWDEVYVVSHTQAGRVRRSRVKSLDRVRAILEKPRFRALVPLNHLDANRRYWVDMVVEVNPVSQEVLERTREMLSPPPGDSETRATRSLLGSVARIFVNESSTSSGRDALTFASAPFPVPREGGKP